MDQPKANTAEYKPMRARDQERRERVMEIVAANELHAAEDYDHAAYTLNHGDASEWLKQALKR